MSFDTLHTADYSPLVVHFTKGERMVREDIVGEDDPLFPHRLTTARERLINILVTKTIHASPMPFLPTEQRAVCFTECIWDGLNGLADHYSSYGIVFSKRLIFDGGGGHEIGAHQLPENRMIPMEVYRNIKTAWAER
jgi:hypothetical protein